MRLPAGVPEFNAVFMGDAGLRIKRDIASPALWSLKGLAERFGDSPTVFRDLCRLKWSFHIKPDVVIRIPGHRSICVEAKLESGQSSYPVRPETVLFDSVVGKNQRVGQFDLQRFMFERLLGEPVSSVMVQKRYPRSGASAPTLIWGEIFSQLAIGDDARTKSIPFVFKLLDENASLLSSYADHRLNGGG